MSITIEADFCVAALEEAVDRHGKPEIMNTDQGSQFTSLEFTDMLPQHGIAISMDGCGCWRDNVFVERLWKSIKYEDVYLKAYETVSAVHAGLATYIAFYSTRRPHSAHGGSTSRRGQLRYPADIQAGSLSRPNTGYPRGLCSSQGEVIQ